MAWIVVTVIATLVIGAASLVGYILSKVKNID